MYILYAAPLSCFVKLLFQANTVPGFVWFVLPQAFDWDASIFSMLNCVLEQLKKKECMNITSYTLLKICIRGI